MLAALSGFAETVGTFWPGVNFSCSVVLIFDFVFRQDSYDTTKNAKRSWIQFLKNEPPGNSAL